MGLLPPVVATLIADTAEYSASMDKAIGKMGELDAASDTAGAKFTKFGNLAADAVLGLGVAAGAFALDEGYKLTETMDQLQNSTGLSNKAIKSLTQTLIQISDKTGASTSDLAASYASIYQAGFKGAAGIKLLDVAAKGALATNSDVTATTQALIAVQALHLKGTKNLADVMGELVAGSHNVTGGLQEEVSLLQGKVGAAFSEYGFSLKQAIEYGSIFAKVGLPTRSIATLATGLGKILEPIHTVTDSNGKLEHGLSSTYLKIEQLGLKYSKVASDVRTGNLAGLLLYLKQVAQETNQPLSVLLNTVLGSGGSISGSLLLKNLGAVKTVTDNIKGAGAGSLNSAFETASQQFGNKLKIIETNLKNSAAQFGLILIPYLSKAATFLENALTSLEEHPGERKALEIDLGVTFAAALALKIAQATQSTTQTSLLTRIAANTAKTAGEGGVSDVEGGGTDAALVGGGAVTAGKFSSFLGKFGIGADALAAAAPALLVLAGQKNASGQPTKGPYPGSERIGGRVMVFNEAEFNTARFNAGQFDATNFPANLLPRPTGGKKPGKVTIKHTASVKVH